MIADFVCVEDPRLAAGLVRLALAKVRASRMDVGQRLAGLAEVIARDHLLQPAAVCRVLPVWFEDQAPTRLRIGGQVIEGDALGRLAGATEVAIVFATLGAAWSAAVSACFTRGEVLRGFLLDEIGTAALERLSSRLQAGIRLSARRRGQQAGSPLEPGQPGLPLNAQFLLAQLADVGSAGIHVTPAGMLSPVKSISMIVGLGQGLRRWTRTQACRECPSWTQCQSTCRPAEPCQ